MFSQIGRLKQVAIFAGVALSLLVAGAAPMMSVDHVEAAKKKDKYANIAIQSISFEGSAQPGHRTVVVEVANTGMRDASGFRIKMVAKDIYSNLRPPAFSLPLSIPKGGSEEVEFTVGCGWLNNGSVTAAADPNPVPGEPDTKTANNTLSESYGLCVIQMP